MTATTEATIPHLRRFADGYGLRVLEVTDLREPMIHRAGTDVLLVRYGLSLDEEIGACIELPIALTIERARDSLTDDELTEMRALGATYRRKIEALGAER